MCSDVVFAGKRPAALLSWHQDSQGECSAIVQACWYKWVKDLQLKSLIPALHLCEMCCLSCSFAQTRLAITENLQSDASKLEREQDSILIYPNIEHAIWENIFRLWHNSTVAELDLLARLVLCYSWVADTVIFERSGEALPMLCCHQ